MDYDDTGSFDTKRLPQSKSDHIRDAAKKRDKSFAWCIILLGSAWLPVSIYITGSTLSILWRWFVVPSLHLPALTFGYAYGISLLVSFLRFKMTEDDLQGTSRTNEESFKRLLRSIVTYALTAGITLALGYAVNVFCL